MNKQTKLAMPLGSIMMAITGFANAGTCISPCNVEATGDAEIHLDDISVGGLAWEIETNLNGALLVMGAKNGVLEPFKIERAGSANTLYIGTGGNVGINNDVPAAPIDIKSMLPRIFLRDTTPTTGKSARVTVNEDKLLLEDNSGTDQFVMELTGSTTNQLYLDDSGAVGINKANPTSGADLEVGGGGNILLENGTEDWAIKTSSAELIFRNGNNTIYGSYPFRIENQTPDTNFIMKNNGNIGMGGVFNPQAALHLKRVGGGLIVEDSNSTTAVRNVVKLRNNGGVGFQLEDTSNTNKWEFRTGGSGAFLISDVNVGGAKMLMNSTGLVKMGKNVAAGSNAWNFELDADGDLHILGNMFVSGTQLTVPDYVFADDYKLMPLDELQSFVQKEKHLPNIASESDIKKSKTVNVGKSQMKHLEKIEELTLYTIQQHQQIKDQQQQIEALRESVAENTKMKEQLASLEKLVTNLASANGHLSLSGAKVAAAK